MSLSNDSMAYPSPPTSDSRRLSPQKIRLPLPSKFLEVPDLIHVQPPTPDDKTGFVLTDKSPVAPPSPSPSVPSHQVPMRSRIISPPGSTPGSPSIQPKKPMYSEGSWVSSGQDVRPPRRKKSPTASPAVSPVGSRRNSNENMPTMASAPALALTLALATPPSPVKVEEDSATTPTASSAESDPMAIPMANSNAGPRRRTSLRGVALSFNSRRTATGRPTLQSATSALDPTSLRLNLNFAEGTKYDPVSQKLVSTKPAPFTSTGVISINKPEDLLASPGRSPLIRKKSGELVKSSLKMTLSPMYDSNPLSASTHCSSATSPSESPYAYSRSLPTTPKEVHFDSKLERVRLFLKEQTPAAVSRGGSPSDEFGIDGSGSDGREFPFPSTSDEEDLIRKSLTIVLHNFASQRPSESDIFLDSIALTEDSRNLRGVVHVRNIAFQKNISARFTFDNWATTSEVAATYIDSIREGQYDRFVFLIRLHDILARINGKTLFICLKFSGDGHRPDIWDSNGGANYQVEFQRAAGKLSSVNGKRGSKRGNDWNDKQSPAGAMVHRMADLKRQLSQLAVDDNEEDLESLVQPPRYRSSLLDSSLSEPSQSPSGSISPLAARYDLRASLKSSGKNSPSIRGSAQASFGTGWNGSPVNHLMELPDVGGATSPMIGLKFDGSASSPYAESSVYPGTHFQPRVSPTVSSSLPNGFASTGLSPSLSTSSVSTPPTSGRHHARSKDQGLDYFTATSVRRTPPASPRAPVPRSFDHSSSSEATKSEPSLINRPGRRHRDFTMPTFHDPAAGSFSTSSASSASSNSDNGEPGSPASGVSTPSLTSSSEEAPSECLWSPTGGLAAPNPGPASYSEFVNQFCFYTGESDRHRIPSSSVESFFNHNRSASSSGHTTPTSNSPRAVPTRHTVSLATIGSPSLSDSDINFHQEKGESLTPTNSYTEEPSVWTL